MKQFFLPVGQGHELSVTYAGNPEGLPILFLHGGPGAGCKLEHFDYFDLSACFVVLFDQRGCGNSKPYGELTHNTTHHLIADIEAIRQYFAIKKWLLFGGSWGSCLALAYTEHHPEHVHALILRSICLAREEEQNWLYGFGANQLFPAAWQNLVNYIQPFIPEGVQLQPELLLKAYYQRLVIRDQQAAWHWANWALACLELPQIELWPESSQEAEHILTLALIETHYFSQQIFLKRNQIVHDLKKITHLPAIIIHGSHDYLCPVNNAYLLHHLWPNSQLRIVSGAGHLSSSPGMKEKLVEAVEYFLATLPPDKDMAD